MARIPVGVAAHGHVCSHGQHRARHVRVALAGARDLTVLQLLCIPTKMSALRPTGDLQPQAPSAMYLLNIPFG